MEKPALFRKSVIDTMSSPDQLNDYIRLSNPSVWVILAAVLLLLIGAFFWAYLGTLPTVITASGIGSDGGVVCYLSQEDAAAVCEGMAASLGESAATVTDIGEIPLSFAEASLELHSDYARQAVTLSDWNVRVVLAVDAPAAEGQIYQVRITAGEIRPIDFVLN